MTKLRDLTPADYRRCGMCHCPAVFQLENGHLAIVGNAADEAVLRELENRVGPGEGIVVVDAAMIAGAINTLENERKLELPDSAGAA